MKTYIVFNCVLINMNNLKIYPKNTKYHRIKLFMALKGIVLLTSEAEYNKLLSPKRVMIMSYCLHISENILVKNIVHGNSGVLCKKCSYDFIMNNGKIEKKNKEHYKFNNYIEGKSIELLIKYISKDFNCIRTHESCHSDLLVKPINNSNNLWLPLQLKSTIGICKTTNCYSFGLNKKDYTHNILILISICNKYFWVIEDPEKIKKMSKITIGLNDSIYNVYKINKFDISNKILQLYSLKQNYLNKKEYLMIPQNKFALIEYEYRILRENKLNFLNFEYPLTQNQVFDFLLNNFKIQEKVGNQKINSRNFRFSITKTVNNKKASYCIGDNDFYWLHIPNKKNFYVIPEKALFNEKIIGSNKTKSLFIDLDTNKDNWYNKYKYDYEDDESVHNLKRIFEYWVPKKNNSNNNSCELEDMIKNRKLKTEIILTKRENDQIYKINKKKERKEKLLEYKIKIKKENLIESKNKCILCNKVIKKESKYCIDCYNKNHIKKFEIQKNELEKLLFIKKLPLTKIGKIYNVSDNAVRKRCIALDIILPKKKCNIK